jgi:D-alanine-D-alanine ligase-like ATP-grasp enzyme
VPEGEEFLLPWWAERIKSSQQARGNHSIRTTAQVEEYIVDNLGYPVYIKPVGGSKGLGVHRVDSSSGLPTVFDEYHESRIKVAIVETAVDMPDYRLVVLDGELISAYERKPLAVTGNGNSTIKQLLAQTQAEYFNQGRDTLIDSSDARIIKYLAKLGLGIDSVPTINQEVTVMPISNLSAGGTSVDVTPDVSSRWSDLASFVAQNFNLRLCGLDLACQDITRADSDYNVLEVNSSPGLDHYASSGQQQKAVVDRLYKKVLNAYPSKSN